ncbi:MAG: ribosome silencing factor [Betaproteobacteria bacterium]
MTEQLSHITVDALEGIKAQDIVVIDINKANSLFDRIIVASVDSTRQAKALVNHLKEEISKIGQSIVGVEGEDSGEWVLIDLGDIVVHVMQPAIREYYNIEDLWMENTASKFSQPDAELAVNS